MQGELEILNLHAQGGMAEVFRARATDAKGRNWFYAVKRVRPELLKDPNIKQMFIEEQRIAACLAHENIVRVYDLAQSSGMSGDETYIVMEFLDGKDLQEIIDGARALKKKLPVWFAMHVAHEVLRALDYAYMRATDKRGRALGLIHRDVSPHNVFITTSGDVKLTDFGVARVQHAEVKTRAGIIKGKFGYMSPEQLHGDALDGRSDLYNVGILLYETLTGRRLFFGENATDFVKSMMKNAVPPLPADLSVPPELDQLMRRTLSKERDKRPRSAAEFLQEITTIAAKYWLAASREQVAAQLRELFAELRPPNDVDTEPVPVGVMKNEKPKSDGAKLTLMAPRPSEIDDDVFASGPAPKQRGGLLSDHEAHDTVFDDRQGISRPDLPEVDDDVSTVPMRLPKSKMSDEDSAATIVDVHPGKK